MSTQARQQQEQQQEEQQQEQKAPTDTAETKPEQPSAIERLVEPPEVDFELDEPEIEEPIIEEPDVRPTRMNYTAPDFQAESMEDLDDPDPTTQGDLASFALTTFEAPNFREETKPPASEPQGGYARVVEVVDHGIRYTVDLTTGEKKAVREGESGLGDDATLRVVKWSKEPVKARNQNIGNGSIVVGRGGVRYVPGVRREPGGARDTGGPRTRPERM